MRRYRCAQVFSPRTRGGQDHREDRLVARTLLRSVAASDLVIDHRVPCVPLRTEEHGQCAPDSRRLRPQSIPARDAGAWPARTRGDSRTHLRLRSDCRDVRAARPGLSTAARAESQVWRAGQAWSGCGNFRRADGSESLRPDPVIRGRQRSRQRSRGLRGRSHPSVSVDPETRRPSGRARGRGRHPWGDL